MKLILNHQSLWLPSLEIRDFDRSDQIALITISDFSLVTALVWWNKIFLCWQLKCPQFFNSPPPTLTKAKKSCFPPYFKFITELSDLWMSGDTEERMRQRRFMRGALGRELQTFGGTSFFSGFCLHHHCHSYWHHHSLHLVIRVKSLRARLHSSWENHFDWWMKQSLQIYFISTKWNNHQSVASQMFLQSHMF